MRFRVDVVYDAEYDGYVAECPTLPGCMSQGRTAHEALTNIREAMLGYLKVAKAKRMKIPVEPSSIHYISLKAA